MEIFYWLLVKSYSLLIRLASPFYPKAGLWLKGRRSLFKDLSSRLTGSNAKRIWFHCSSLGEFEQGKPVLERLRNEYADYKIILTFFSPSGYELKKNDPSADYVFYLPLDGPSNSNKFIEIVRPQFAVFVKYEFWHFYIKLLKEKKIPCFVISASFRPSQIYFKWYGKFFYRILQRITHIFVQNQSSLELLYKHAINNVTVSGDTRFDRVYIISRNPKKINGIEKFSDNKPLFIAGSTWPADEKILEKLIEEWHSDWKFIIAPHEVDSKGIQNLRSKLNGKTILYSELEKKDVSGSKVLIIDSIGFLSSLYAYGKIAYIGGGFGSGIHNTLEAAAYGLPVLFGPNYSKFREAEMLVKGNSGFAVSSYSQLKDKVTMLAGDASMLSMINEKNKKMIESNRGASDVFINYLKLNYPPQ